VLRDDHTLNPVRPLVDLGVLADLSTCITESAIVGKSVHSVRRITCRRS